MSQQTRKVVMVETHRIGRQVLHSGDELTLEKSLADMLISVGHANCKETGEHHEKSDKPVRVVVSDVTQYEAS